MLPRDSVCAEGHRGAATKTARSTAWLAEAAADYGCAIHAYVLMTNHARDSADGRERAAHQSLGRRYVHHINTTYQRTGTL